MHLSNVWVENNYVKVPVESKRKRVFNLVTNVFLIKLLNFNPKPDENRTPS